MPTKTIADTDTAELVARWQRNPTPKVMGELHKRHVALVHSILNRFELDDESREFLAGSALLRVFMKLDTYDPARGALSTWIGNITRNMALDWLKRRQPAYVDHKSAVMTTAPADAAPWLLTPDDVMTMHAFIPWRVTNQCLLEVGQHFVEAEGRVTRASIEAVSGCLICHRAAWNTWASATQVTEFLFALIRHVKATPDDVQRVLRRLRNYSTTSGLGLVVKLCGREAAAQLLLLFGGVSLTLPGIRELTALDAQHDEK